MLKEISIEIIRKCPNLCLHCSSMAHKQCEEILPYDKFKEVVSDAAKLGAKIICLSGGEPFLHDSIVNMVKYIKKQGLECYIYTSGIVLDEFENPTSLSKNVLSEISEYVTKLIFNIEAGTEHTYDKIMGTKNCFSKMQQSVICAVEVGIHTEAHFVPMNINVEEIDKVVTLCKNLHICKLSFLRLVLHGRAKQNKEELELSEKKYLELKKHLQNIREQVDMEIRVGVPLLFDTSCYKCEAAKGKLNIKYDGYVFPCEVFKNNSMEKSLGGVRPDNIYQKTLADIYNYSEYLNSVRRLSKRFSDRCETCVGQYLITYEKEER